LGADLHIQSEGDWTGKVENGRRQTFPAVVEACCMLTYYRL